MAEENLNIYQKLAKIRKTVEVVQRNKSGYGYKYVTDTELLAKITSGMDKYGVSLIPQIVKGSTIVEPYTYKKLKREKQKDGSYASYEEPVNEILTHGDMQYVWVNNDNPEEQVLVDWTYVGQQADASQSFGSGLTYSMRYFLLKYFNVSTPEDDPDNWRSKQREAAEAEDKALAAQAIGELDILVRSYLAKNPGSADEVKKFICKFVKDGNYLAINESALATKLLNDFIETYIKGE